MADDVQGIWRMTGLTPQAGSSLTGSLILRLLERRPHVPDRRPIGIATSPWTLVTSSIRSRKGQRLGLKREVPTVQ
jgi:hypothetical protein